ncbi:hypothetical protein CL634_10110 [bacterium]|nr:hypothetical protein [bacterium]
MASVDTKISDLPTVSSVKDANFILITEENVGNFKILSNVFSQESAEKAGSVFITGNQDIAGLKNFTEGLQVNGNYVISSDKYNKETVSATDIAQDVSGIKTWLDYIHPKGGVATAHTDGFLCITDGRAPSTFEEKNNSLSLAFQQGVYVTGGSPSTSNLYVEGAVSARTIDSLEDIVGQHGPTIWTDGRDPDLFEDSIHPRDRSLTLAFMSGVYITGGANNSSDLHVEGSVSAKTIESLEDIVGQHGPTVWTDGRDPDLFVDGVHPRDESLTLAFMSGVLITGGANNSADLYVEGSIRAKTIETLEDIIGHHGPTVWTDGSNPDLFEPPDKSLTLGFENGVYISGLGTKDSDLHVDGSIKAKTIETLEDVIGTTGSTVWTDGRDPDLFPWHHHSLVLAFQSGVNITGSSKRAADLHVDGTGYFNTISPETWDVDGLTFKGKVEFEKLVNFTHHNFNDNLSSSIGGSADLFLPLNATNETSTLDNNQSVVAPYVGRVKKVMIRGSVDSANLSFSIRSKGNGLTQMGQTLDLKEEIFMTNYTQFDTATFEFAETGHFQKGDLVGVCFDSDADLGITTATVEWEYNQVL